MARPLREFTRFSQWMQTKCQAAANPQANRLGHLHPPFPFIIIIQPEGLEDSHRGWGGDVLRQTVPNTNSVDRKSQVTDGGQSSTAHNQWWTTEEEQSCWRASTPATWESSSTRCEGADPWRHLYTRNAHLKAVLSGAFSQWRWWGSNGKVLPVTNNEINRICYWNSQLQQHRQLVLVALPIRSYNQSINGSHWLLT